MKSAHIRSTSALRFFYLVPQVLPKVSAIENLSRWKHYMKSPTTFCRSRGNRSGMELCHVR